MQPASSLDRAGRRRSPATPASFHEGRAPRDKGLRYPPDPPTVEEIISVMRAAGDDADGVRLRALFIVLWRAGLPISEALALAETDLCKTLPVGAFFCILHGATPGRRCSSASIRAQLHRTAAAAGIRCRFAPHQLRHAHAVEMSREGVPFVVIQRQLGHADLGVTSPYLRGIDSTEIIHTVDERPTPMIRATARLTTDA